MKRRDLLLERYSYANSMSEEFTAQSSSKMPEIMSADALNMKTLHQLRDDGFYQSSGFPIASTRSGVAIGIHVGAQRSAHPIAVWVEAFPQPDVFLSLCGTSTILCAVAKAARTTRSLQMAYRYREAIDNKGWLVPGPHHDEQALGQYSLDFDLHRREIGTLASEGCSASDSWKQRFPMSDAVAIDRQIGVESKKFPDNFNRQGLGIAQFGCRTSGSQWHPKSTT